MSFVQDHSDRIKVDPESDCWLWIGYVMKSNGYGYFNKKRAHRWVWEQLIGPLTPDQHLDHFKCEVKTCVNPEHLKITTPGEHNRRHKTGQKMKLSPQEVLRRKEHGKKMIANAQSKSYSKRTRSEVATAMWDERTPERRAEIGRSISASKRGDA